MKIVVNGTDKECPAGTTLEELVAQTLGSPIPAGVAVAINYEVIIRSQWPTTRPEENDEIEILWASAGG